jgi:hypothetical protein
VRNGLCAGITQVTVLRRPERGVSGWAGGAENPGAFEPQVATGAVADDATLAEFKREIEDRLMREGVAAYAGVAAEFPTERGWSSAHGVSSSSDRCSFAARASRWGCEVGDLSWQHFRAAIDFVDEHWGAVSAVAAALRERPILSMDAVREIVASAPHARNPLRERRWDELPLDLPTPNAEAIRC